MKLNGVHHLNIRCAVSDLPAIEKFYGELMGLKKGYRPDFPGPASGCGTTTIRSSTSVHVCRGLPAGPAPQQRGSHCVRHDRRYGISRAREEARHRA